MSDQEFIENQVKFMYGKYYNKVINNDIIYINSSEYNNNKNTIDITTDNINDENYIFHNRRPGFTNILIYYFKKYYNFNKKSIIRYDYNDRYSFDDFTLVHNRDLEIDNGILFHLDGYTNINFNINNNELNFEQKSDKLIWRGSSTGFRYNDIPPIRYRLLKKYFDNQNFDLGFNNLVQLANFTNEEINIMKSKYTKNFMNFNEMTKYKYILSLSGNDYASNLPHILNSNCCPLANYPFRYVNYLYGNNLKPFVHFVPISNNCDDLEEVYKWCLDNQGKCLEISENGKKYMEKYNNKILFEKIMKRFIELYPIVQYK